MNLIMRISGVMAVLIGLTVCGCSGFGFLPGIDPTAETGNITPIHLNICAVDMEIAGDYAYVTAANSGLHVFHLVPGAAPEWVNALHLDGRIGTLQISGQVAYALSSESDFYIVDI